MMTHAQIMQLESMFGTNWPIFITFGVLLTGILLALPITYWIVTWTLRND